MTRTALFFSLLFICTLGVAQNESLKSAKIKVDSLFFANQVEGLELSEHMLPKAYAAKDTFHITYFLDQAGELNRMLGNYDKAITQINKCLTYKAHWKDLKDLSLSYNNLGKAYVNKGLYELGAKNFTIALQLMEKANNLQGQAYYLNNLGALYDLQHNYTKAISYYERSLKIKETLKDSVGMGATSVNLGISYYNLTDYPQAIHYFEWSIKINRKLQNPTKIARGLINLGKVYLDMKELTAARNCFYEAYRMRSKIEDAQLQTNLLNNISQYHLSKNQLDSAFYFNDQAVKLARSSNAFKQLRDVFTQRAELFSKNNQPDSAYQCLQYSVKYNDSLLNEANIYAVAEMEGKYNYEKNLRKIQEQKLQKVILDRKFKAKSAQLAYAISGVVILLVLVLFLFFLFRTKKHQAALLEGQNSLIQQKKKDAEALNTKLTLELDQLQITVEEKERLLQGIFGSKKEVELPPELLSLSKREMEVLGYLALGRSDEEIAQRLFVSKSTIKTHLRRIYSKLLVNGRTEAVAIAFKYSLFASE